MAGTLIVSNLKTDTDNTFIVRSNTGTTLFSANTSGIDIANSIGATAITNDKILSVANTKISGNIISSQITSVANTQISGNITAAQITSVANTQLTGTLIASQIASVNATTATSGTLPTARLPAGSVLQVINSVKTDTQSVTSASYVDITSLTVTITPTSSSSKILVRACVNNLSDTAAYGVFINLLRGSTTLTYSTSGPGNANTYTAWASGGGGDTRIKGSCAIDYLDSPATTSATTYKMQMLTPVGTAYINSWALNRDVASVSSITVMEIAG